MARAAAVVCVLALGYVCAVMAGMVPVEMGHLNEHDEVTHISTHMMTEELYALSVASATAPSPNTPATLSAAIGAAFPATAPTIHWKFPVFSRPASLKAWCDCNVAVLYNVHDRKPEPWHDPCELPTGNFTFIATADNQLTFGSPKDCLEWGTKHVHMANMRPGFAAGEIVVRIDEAGKRVIRWNLKSGCFSRLLVEQNGAEYSAALQKGMSAIWAASSCAADFNFQTAPLLEEGPPTVEEIRDICRNDLGKKQFNHLQWTACAKPLRRALENATLCTDRWHLPKCLPFESESNKKQLMSSVAAAEMPLDSFLAADDVMESAAVPLASSAPAAAPTAPTTTATVNKAGPSAALLAFLCAFAAAVLLLTTAAVYRFRDSAAVTPIGEPTFRSQTTYSSTA